MNIEKIVEQALKNGYLTPEMKLEVEQFTDSTNLDKLSLFGIQCDR